MTFSQKLKDLVVAREAVDADGEALSFACDMTSTAGYDNDGSIGPEMLDNGIGLAFAAYRYDPEVAIFFVFGDDNKDWPQAYYVFGKDEDDACRRLTEALAAYDATPSGD